VRDPECRQHLRDVVLDAVLRDTHRAMILQSDGSYTPALAAAGEVPFSSQQFLLEYYTRTPVPTD
jgi:hypothetical protein